MLDPHHQRVSPQQSTNWCLSMGDPESSAWLSQYQRWSFMTWMIWGYPHFTVMARNTSYKLQVLSHPIYRMYNPIETTTYN